MRDMQIFRHEKTEAEIDFRYNEEMLKKIWVCACSREQEY